MKKQMYTLASFMLILSLLFTSCGPSKRVIASDAKIDKLQRDNANTLSQLNDCNSQVKNLKDEKATLQNTNDSVLNDLNSLTLTSKMTIADQAKRLKTLQNMMQAQKDIMSKLKNSIADALMNYKTDELTVYYENGNVYVSMEEKLLFKSGSAVVDPKGKEALKTLAKVISGTKDITVMIEGHTDNVPIKTKQFEDNWDLSTTRATSIVRILTVDYGFDPARITASGKGLYHPVKPNGTDVGRAANRRTEVILSPDLKELYKLIYQ
jgi:chemotaxis protein MotB